MLDSRAHTCQCVLHTISLECVAAQPSTVDRVQVGFVMRGGNQPPGVGQA